MVHINAQMSGCRHHLSESRGCILTSALGLLDCLTCLYSLLNIGRTPGSKEHHIFSKQAPFNKPFERFIKLREQVRSLRLIITR